LTGTHSGNLFGIPPTGKKVDVYEIAILKLSQEKIVEGWFMADEAGLLKQLGAKLPPRNDGKVIAPEIADVGEDGDVVLKRLTEKPPATQADRNKIVVARSKSSTPAKGDRAADFKQRRPGFQNMREYGDANGVGNERLVAALPDRRDTIHDLIAEGDKVWMQFQVRGTQTARLYGLAPTGRRISVPEVGVATFAGGKWQEGWYFADELGALLQLGVPNMLVGEG
jgi:predicted ester cyclase